MISKEIVLLHFLFEHQFAYREGLIFVIQNQYRRFSCRIKLNLAF